MTKPEKFDFMSRANFPIDDILNYTKGLAADSEYIFIGVTNGNSLLAADVGKPTYDRLYDIVKTEDFVLAEKIYEYLLYDPELSAKHKIILHHERKAVALYEGENYTIFMLCKEK